MLLLNFNPFPVLETERLILRQVSEKDIDEIFFLRSDPKILQFLGRDPAINADEALRFIKMINELEKNNEGITWGIVLKPHNKLIGTICYWNIMKGHYRAEVGYGLHTAFQGKGIMQEALQEVLRYGFETINLHSAEARTDPKNISSIKLLERNHFIREGLFKEDFFYKDNFLDTAVYSLLKKNYATNI